MARWRPAASPLSFHKPTGQYYVTRNRKRFYLGTDKDEATERYHRLALGLRPVEESCTPIPLTAKELANRFLAAQKANWTKTGATLLGYRNWLKRFLADHPRLRAQDLTVEMFAAWKLSLRCRDYSPTSINHYLKAVRTMYVFAEETELLEKVREFRRQTRSPTPAAWQKVVGPTYPPKVVCSGIFW